MPRRNCRCPANPALVVACLGASNLGAIADQAARRLAGDGVAAMFCLAGIAGGLPGFVRSAKYASNLLVIDGCQTEWARHCLENAGITSLEHIQLEKLGLKRGETQVSSGSIQRVVDAAKHKLRLVRSGSDRHVEGANTEANPSVSHEQGLQP